MTDQSSQPPAGDARPRPQYGEYAPPGWVSPAAEARDAEPAELAPPAGPAAATPPPAAPGRVPTWDRALTRVLLLIGALGAIIGWIIGSDLAASLPVALEQYGITPGTMPEWLDAAGTALIASHLLLYLVAVALTIALRRAGRPTFWAPLTTTIIAAVIFWSVMTAAIAPYADQLQP